MSKLQPKVDVRLEPFLPEEVTDRYVGWLNDPAVVRFTDARFSTHTAETARAYVDRAKSDRSSKLWRVVVDGQRHVGTIRLSDIDGLHHRAFVSLLIGEKDQWGRGIGSVAVEVACEYAFSVLNLHKVYAAILADHGASLRLFEKLGFEIEARLKDHGCAGDRYVDVVYVSRFKSPSSARLKIDR